jgi:putative copper export protein
MGGGWDTVLDALTSDAYGALLIAKIAAFVLLIILAWLHRRRAVGDLLEGGRPFWQIVGTELFVMALTLGLSVALSQTA